METFYLVCAGGGGALILCQFLAGFFGLGGDHHVEVDHDVHADAGGDHESHPASSFFGWFTFRTVAAAITFFGLGGLTARYYQMPDSSSFVVAVLAGCSALYLVGMLMKTMLKLKADGTVRIEKAIGQIGRVYLAIPGKNGGSGKVTLTVQNRTVECQAMTAQNEIATGSAVQVIAVLGPNLVEVSPVSAG